MRSDLLHKKLLAEQKLILDKAIRICRASENAYQGIETLADGSQQSVEEIAWLQGKIKVWKQKDQSMKALKCVFCSQTHNFGCKNCLGWGRRCNACNDQNHFARSTVCIKRMQVVKYDQEVVGVDKGVRALFLGKVESGRNKNNFEIVVEVVNNKYNNSRVKMKINTWADVTKVGKNQLPLFGVLIADVKQSKKCLIRPDKHDFECYGHFEEINRK